ncbi:MAG TPA: ATP F0F1 synthase subunit B [Beijerinckia sp.]|jgi:F-type H+-transporting ATPase subunit b|nr:ATP F0F1 synthase subunit B [Beijerinckia sp.]
MELNEEFYVALGFLVFLGLLAYLGVHTKLVAALDRRGALVKAELASAVRLREEAAAVLASFEKKKAEAEAEAAELVAQARAEAELLAKETHERMAEFVQRRTKQAEEKIATAEAQAMAQVRAAAADAATKAAETVLKVEARGAYGEDLINKGIADLKGLVH